MKYPKEQFEKLVGITEVLSKVYVNLADQNPNALHFLAYQNVNEFQSHNAIVLDKEGNPMKQHWAETMGKDYDRLLPIDNEFKLYPDGCNDNHVETAMKRVLKQLNLTN